MTFDSVYHLLLWFFNKLWIRPPKSPGNHDPIYIQGSNTFYDARDVWDTVTKISLVIEMLPPRDKAIIKALFTRHMHISEVAERMKLTERRIRQIRQRTLNLLQDRCLYVGLVCESKYDPPVYL